MRRAHTISLAGLLVSIAALSGCLERTIHVTSEPSGALVWLNDVEIGRTPAEARFKFYGTYDVRVELPGYEPVHEGRDAKAPFYEYPGPDAIATVLPMRLHNRVEWHFDLTPSATSNSPAAESELIGRAHALRERLGPAPQRTESEGEPSNSVGPEATPASEQGAPAPVGAPTASPTGGPDEPLPGSALAPSGSPG